MPWPRPSSHHTLITALSLFLGGWLIFDGSRKLVTGFYTGEDMVGVGPWAAIVSILGINPDHMAIPFALLGILWIVNGAVVLLGASWRYERTILSSVLTLFYLVPGTIVSSGVLILSFRERRREGKSGRSSEDKH